MYRAILYHTGNPPLTTRARAVTLRSAMRACPRTMFLPSLALAGLVLLAPRVGAAPTFNPGNVDATFQNPGLRITVGRGLEQSDTDPIITGGISDNDPVPGNRVPFGGGTCACTGCSINNAGAGVITQGATVCACGGKPVLDVANTNFIYGGGAANQNHNLRLGFRTAAAANDITVPYQVTVACTMTNNNNVQAGTFNMRVTIYPQINQPPRILNGPPARFLVNEDGSATAKSVPGQTCGLSVPNALTITAGPSWELPPNVPDEGTGDTVEYVANSCTVVDNTQCASHNGVCVTNLDMTVKGPAAQITNSALSFCVEQDAVGVVRVQCRFRDSGLSCCRAPGDANKCPMDIAGFCTTTMPTRALEVTVDFTLVIAEVNDAPVGYFDLVTAMPDIKGPHTWQEDCGLSGYVKDCLTAGAVTPRHQWSPIIWQNMNCPVTQVTAPFNGGVTMYDVCTAGGTINALGATDLQAPSTAVSEWVAAGGLGGDQGYELRCITDRDNLFMNALPGGCPGCGGRVPCGCPSLGANPFNSGLTYTPARHAVGVAAVWCYLIDLNPPAPGTVVDAPTNNNMGGTTAAERGQLRRKLIDFRIEVTEVNDPPSIDLDPKTASTPDPLKTAADPVDRLPRLLFRKDPSWTGPTLQSWVGPSPPNPDPGICKTVDCCRDDDPASVVTVTGHEPNPANYPLSTNSIKIQDCPANRREKCCVIDDVWVQGVWQGNQAAVLNCPGRATPQLCMSAGVTGCMWSGGACVPRGYGDPADSTANAPTYAGFVGALPGPPSEQGPFDPDRFQWDQQWNVKCRAKCDPGRKPLGFHSDGWCDEGFFDGAVMPYTLSSDCYDYVNHRPCAAGQWPVDRHQANNLVFKASSQTALGHRYRRGPVRIQCTQVDEGQPDGSQACGTIEGGRKGDPNLGFGTHMSGCRDTTKYPGTASCFGTGTPGIFANGLPCPSQTVEDNLKRLPDPIEFIIEFTAPNYTLSDYPSSDGFFDNIKDPWWEVLIAEDSDPQEITNFLKDPQAWEKCAKIENMAGTVTTVNNDPALFRPSAQPLIANLLPPDGGDLIFTGQQDMSGHAWVVIGLIDNGCGDPAKVNGPAYEEFVLWFKEINDPPIATLSPAVAPSGRITVTEDTKLMTGGHTFLLYPDLAPGPPREVRPMPTAGGACPLTNTFPGCGVIPITPADATAVKWDTTKRPRLCAQTCGTGALCGCGQQLKAVCTSDHQDWFTAPPTVDATGAQAGTLRFTLKPDASGDVEVSCSFTDCIDVGGVECLKTTDGEDALTTVSKFTLSITDINDPPTIDVLAGRSPIIVDEDSPTETRTVLWNITPGPGGELLTQNVFVKCTVKIGQTQLFQGPIITELVGNAMTVQQARLTFTPAKDAAGTATVVCSASDDGIPKLTTNAPSFKIIINEINDPPTGTLLKRKVTVAEDSGAYAGALIADLIPGPPSEQVIPQQLTTVCTPARADLFAMNDGPTVSSAGVLTFTPAPDAVGTTIVQCVFTDDGTPRLSYAETFEIEITEVNDPPTVTVNGVMMSPTITVKEDVGLVEEATFLTNLSPGPPSEQLTQRYSFQCAVDHPELFTMQPIIRDHFMTQGMVVFHTAPDMSGRTTAACTMTDTGVPAMSTAFSFDIVIEEVNDVPVATVTQNPIRVMEDDKMSTIVGFLSPMVAGPPREVGQQLTSVCTTDTSYFAVQPTITQNGMSGDLHFVLQPDKWGSVGVECTLTDDGQPRKSTTVNFVVDVAEVNDPPVVLQSQDIVRVNEDAGRQTFGAHWTKLAPGPLDEIMTQTITYTCTSTNDALFTAGNTPKVTRAGTIATLTFEAGPDQAGESTVSCSIVDNGNPPMTTNVEFKIVVTDLNDPPKAVCSACATGITVNEDVPWQIIPNFLTDISPGPLSEKDQTLLAKCTHSGTADMFRLDTTATPLIDGSPTIDPVTGTMTFQPAADASFTVVVRCTLTDNGTPARTLSFTQFTLKVTEVNDVPTGTLDMSGRASVAVGSPTTTIPAWITNITPGPLPERTQLVTVTCVAATPALFAASGQPRVDRTTGNLVFTPASSSSEGASLVTCDLTDNGVPPETLALTFTVAFENQPPTATPRTALVTVDEESGPYVGASFLTNLAPGPQVERNQSIATIVCTPVDPSLFSVSPVISTVGTLEFTPAVDAAGRTSITCVVSDNGQPQKSTSVTFEVEVRDVNDKPKIIVNQMTVNAAEGGDKMTVGNFVTLDPGAPSESNQTMVATCVPADPSLVVGGVLLNTAGWNAVNQRNAALEFKPSAQSSGTTKVTCTVSDNGVPSASSTFEFDLVVSETNNLPTGILSRTTVTVPEDSPLFELPGLLTGLSPGPQAEVANGETYSIACVSGDTSLFTPTGQPVVTTAGLLRLTPAPNAVGETDVTCTVTDTGTPARSISRTFKVMIAEANDPPVAVVTVPEVNVPEGSGLATLPNFVSPLNAGAPSESGQVIVTTCVAANPALFSTPVSVASFGLKTGELSFAPAPEAVGRTEVTCNVVDNGVPSLTTSFKFVVNINEVNDPPSGLLKLQVVNVQEDFGTFTANSFLYQVKPGPPSESSQTVTTICRAANTALFSTQPVINSAGDLTLVPNTNSAGSTDVTCTLTDNGVPAASGSLTFKVNILDRNDPPTGTLSTAMVSVPEDSASVVIPDFITGMTAGPATESAQTFATTCLADTPAMFKQQPTIAKQSATVGKLMFQPAKDAVGTVGVRCTIADNVSPPAQKQLTFSVTFTETNDAPIVAVQGNRNIPVQQDVVERTYTFPSYLRVAAGPGSEATQVVTSTCIATNPHLFDVQPQITVVNGNGNLTFVAKEGISQANVLESKVTCSFTDDGQPPMTTTEVFTIDFGLV